jgi:hypothetical protein
VTTPKVNAAARFVGDPGGPIDLVSSRPQRASGTAGRGQFMTLDSGGYAVLGGQSGYVYPGGIVNAQFVTASGVNDGDAWAELWQGTELGLIQSTLANDSFTDSDIISPFYIADENTPGKLPVSAGNDRAFGGLFLGMEHGSTTVPRLLVGPIAGLLAMLLHMKDNDAISLNYAVDGSASTDIASAANPYLIPRPLRRFQITGGVIIPSTALAATSGSDALLTFVKVDTTGGVALGSSPTVASFTTNGTALVAGQPTALTMSGTAANLLLRTTDIIGYYRTHASSGAVIPQSAIILKGKVI